MDQTRRQLALDDEAWPDRLMRALDVVFWADPCPLVDVPVDRVTFAAKLEYRLRVEADELAGMDESERIKAIAQIRRECAAPSQTFAPSKDAAEEQYHELCGSAMSHLVRMRTSERVTDADELLQMAEAFCDDGGAKPEDQDNYVVDKREPSDDAYLSESDVAKAGGVLQTTLRKHLPNWRKTHNNNDWIEPPHPRPRDPKFLYRWGSIKSLVESLRRTASVTAKKKKAAKLR
jgi:hypothetical protein